MNTSLGTMTVKPEVFTNTQRFLYTIPVFFPIIFFVYDALLLAAIIRNRRDTSLPVAYITVMSMTGMISKFVMALNSFLYLVLPADLYAEFLIMFGREITLLGTFSYLNALYISVLMTINRVVVISRPFKTEWFSQRRVFLYSAVILTVALISLLIPYYSDCYIVFRIDLLTFQSGCAPYRHPITTFQNTYAIVLPTNCMFTNMSLIAHLRFARNGVYKRIKSWFKPDTIIVVPFNANTSLSKIQARRDVIMMRQTIAVSLFLSIYELGALMIRTFPTTYASFSQPVRDSIFYVRYESVPCMNFFIYFMQTGSTRRMVKRFVGINENNHSSVDNQTVATVAVRASRSTRN